MRFEGQGLPYPLDDQESAAYRAWLRKRPSVEAARRVRAAKWRRECERQATAFMLQAPPPTDAEGSAPSGNSSDAQGQAAEEAQPDDSADEAGTSSKTPEDAAAAATPAFDCQPDPAEKFRRAEEDEGGELLRGDVIVAVDVFIPVPGSQQSSSKSSDNSSDKEEKAKTT